MRALRNALSSGALLAVVIAAPAAHGDDWRWSVTPYVWFSGMDGKFAITPALPTVEVKQDFGDIFDTTQLALLGKVEAAKGRLHLLADLSYGDIGNAAVINNPNFPNLAAASVDTETFVGNFAAGYRVSEADNYSVDLIGGIRYTFTKLDLNINATSGAVLTSGEDENWGDVFAGVRGEVAISPHWSLTGYGDLGAGLSDYTWQVYGAANYQLNQNWTFFGGYRAYKDKYDNDGYIYNVTEYGPIFGATYRF